MEAGEVSWCAGGGGRALFHRHRGTCDLCLREL